MKKFKILCLLLVVLVAYNFISAFNKITGVSAFLETNTVLIDPGHGGEDGGAIGIDGVHEAKINLEISLKLKEIFEQNGYKVIMTRDSDVDLSDKSIASISERKKSDMQNRLNIINNSNATLVLSIHQNYFEQSKYKGAQVFYAKEESKGLAECIQTSIINDVQINNNRLAKVVDSKYLLNNSTKTMVIVECGFISNKEDATDLQNFEYQEKLAQAIFNGVCMFTK